MMSELKPPYAVPFELAGLSERGAELSVSPDAPERSRIASWLGVLGVPRLDATIRLSHEGGDVYRYDAEFIADVVQACVVTLEPVPSRHAGRVERHYRVVAKTSRRTSRDTDLEVDVSRDDDAPEVISSTQLDIAAPVLEEISLSLDPYPRAPGVTFEPPKDEEAGKENPFAVLAKLKVGPPKEPGAGG